MSISYEQANEIFKQIGGCNKLVSMIGAKSFNYSGDESFVTFRWSIKSKNKANMVKITLTPADVYTVEFSRIYGMKHTIKSTHENVYCDMLIDLFEKETGLYLSL